MGFDDLANTGLSLGLGGFQSIKNPTMTRPSEKECLNIEPSLSLSLSKAGEPYERAYEEAEEKKVVSNEQYPLLNHHLYCQDSAASSFSNMSVKRPERENSGHGTGEDMEIEKVCSRASDEDEDGLNGKKKLRLTKPQSAMLEESFKHRTTITPKQKQELANELNLRPRQVEVWFQNRRARTKLKQTEVDCEFLKKCCETLRDENRRLQKEVQELKALKAGNPYCMQLPAAAAAATLTMCPSCERIVGVGENTSKNLYVVTPPATKPHLFNPFANQSAAC